ncbi:dienelactone hydrolase family protein [Zavarzinia sp. CC-PAN008]|uniref:dienelactone hydrolase family protein n=1 Tax=Zavarzinia sp. CC-PAN008 TaxID=3243332 RepID=UPI003F745619
MSVTAADITLTASDGHRFNALHVVPAGTPKGGLIVAMEIFGLNANIRDHCGRFAGFGYEVVAPAFYDRGERGVDLGYDAAGVEKGRALRDRIGWDKPMLDVAAARDFLVPRGRVAMTGYCYGGSLSWLASCRVPGLACVIGYYGTAILQYMDEVPQCPTMLHFGAKDASIPLDQIEVLRARHPEVEIHVYDAEHGFSSDRRVHYDKAATELALERTLALLERTVG